MNVLRVLMSQKDSKERIDYQVQSILSMQNQVSLSVWISSPRISLGIAFVSVHKPQNRKGYDACSLRFQAVLMNSCCSEMINATRTVMST